MPRLATIVYVVIGVIAAFQHSYYANLRSLSQVLSAVVATALWPLVLLGRESPPQPHQPVARSSTLGERP